MSSGPPLIPQWYFDEFSAGQVFMTMARTVTESDVVAFVGLGGFFEEIWLDARKSQRDGLYSGRLAPGYLTLLMAEGLFVLTGCMHNAVGLLGLTDLRFTAPVMCGDTIKCTVSVTNARPTKNPTRGVIECNHEVTNQAGTVVSTFTTARLILRRPDEPDAPPSENR